MLDDDDDDDEDFWGPAVIDASCRWIFVERGTLASASMSTLPSGVVGACSAAALALDWGM